jgi:Rrf2 family protein
MLSQKTRYALKALLELATLPAGSTLSSSAISSRRAIPVKFLEAILSELKRAGFVRAQRGRIGGYQLARGADAISFGNVVRVMEGPLALLPCVSVTQYYRCADCAAARDCELQRIFRVLRDSTASILDGWSLADASGKTGSPGTRVGTSAAKKARRQSSVKVPSPRKGAAKGSRHTALQ